jgi:DNA-binding CsgD family transcriptional regulator
LTGLLLENLGDLYAVIDDLDRAASLSEEALSLLAAAGDRYRAGIATANLAWIALYRGAVANAAGHWDEVLATAQALGDPWFLGDAFAGFAGVAAASGNPERAARLLGAAETQRLTSGRSTLPHGFQQRRLLASVLDALGDAALERGLAAGRALPFDRALIEARTALAADDGRNETDTPLEKTGLSPRELEVLRLVAAGRTNPEIGALLFISPRTASTHVSHILAKLGATSRAEAIAFALRHGLT